jgi:hypothetical protein
MDIQQCETVTCILETIRIIFSYYAIQGGIVSGRAVGVEDLESLRANGWDQLYNSAPVTSIIKLSPLQSDVTLTSFDLKRLLYM